MIAKSRVAARTELQLCCLFAAVFAINGVHLPFFPLWLTAKGVTPGEIAILVALLPALRVVSTLVAARHGDRRGNYGALVVAFGLGVVSCYAAMGWVDGYAQIFLCVLALGCAQGPITVLVDGITLGEARRRRETGDAALHYSFVRGWGSASILASMILGGAVAAAIPNSALIWLLFAVAAGAVVASSLALRGLPSASAPPRRHAPEPLARPVLVALVIASAALTVSSHGFSFAFGALHWKQNGWGESFVSLSWAAALVTESVFFLGAGRWFGGERRAMAFLAAAGAGGALRWLWMAFDPGAAGVIGAQLLHAFSMAAAQLGPAYLLSGLCGRERLAQAQGWFAAACSIGLSLATLASGPLRASFGEKGYFVMAAIAGVGFALALAAGALAKRAPPAPGAGRPDAADAA